MPVSGQQCFLRHHTKVEVTLEHSALCQNLTAATSASAIMAEAVAVPTAGDLTQQLAKHMDRHLVFPLLEFLHHRQLYDEADIQKTKIALLDHTNMVDFAMDIHESLFGKGSVPQAMNDRREEVGWQMQLYSSRAVQHPLTQAWTTASSKHRTVELARPPCLQVLARLKSLQADAETIVGFLSNEASVKQLKQDKTYNLKFLQEVQTAWICPVGSMHRIWRLAMGSSPAQCALCDWLCVHTAGIQHWAAPDRCAVPLCEVPVRVRQLQRSVGVPVPLPHPVHRQRAQPVGAVGQAGRRDPAAGGRPGSGVAKTVHSSWCLACA